MLNERQILQVRPFTKEGTCQVSVKMFPSHLYQFMKPLDLQQDSKFYLQQMQNITVFSGY